MLPVVTVCPFYKNGKNKSNARLANDFQLIEGEEGNEEDLDQDVELDRLWNELTFSITDIITDIEIHYSDFDTGEEVHINFPAAVCEDKSKCGKVLQ